MTQSDRYQMHWDSFSADSSFQLPDAFQRSSPNCPLLMQQRTQWSIGQFSLHEQIYKGKTSRVYTATDKLSLLHVVIKYYKKDRLTPLNKYQVEREISIHLGLRHDNIISLYAAFEDESNVYMVLEKATGGDLFQQNAFASSLSRKTLEMNTAENVVAPFLTVLNYLHGKGIIHRDIKPENILMMADDTLKLADFGLAIDMNEERPVTRTGTLDYMAPEVLRCPDKTSPEQYKEQVELAYTSLVDVWAVGILVYELLAGQAPFEKESRIATYHNILSGEPEFPPWLSPGAVSFVKIALCKDANNRPSADKLFRHPWLQSFISSRQEFRSSTGGIHKKISVLQTVPLSSDHLASASASTFLTSAKLLTDVAVIKQDTAHDLEESIPENTRRHVSMPAQSKSSETKPPDDTTSSTLDAAAHMIALEKQSAESMLGGSGTSRTGSKTCLESLASPASGSKPLRLSNSGSLSQSTSGHSPPLQSMGTTHPTLMHLHSLQHQPAGPILAPHFPHPPQPSHTSSLLRGNGSSSRRISHKTPSSILESIHGGASKQVLPGTPITKSSPVSSSTPPVSCDRTSPTSGLVSQLQPLHHPLHRMKLQIQINAESSQSNSEGFFTPLSTPGSIASPSTGPLVMLSPTAGPTSGSPFDSMQKPSGCSRQGSPGKGSSGTYQPVSFLIRNKSLEADGSRGASLQGTALDGAAANQGAQAQDPFQPLRRRSSLPGLLRSSGNGINKVREILTHPRSQDSDSRLPSHPQSPSRAGSEPVNEGVNAAKAERSSWPRQPSHAAAFSPPQPGRACTTSPRAQGQLPSLPQQKT